MEILHVFGQESFHDDVYIVGTISELTRLRNTIDEAILNNFSVGRNFCVNDGEGYSVEVTKITDLEVDKLAVPYTALFAREKSENAVYPWQIES